MCYMTRQSHCPWSDSRNQERQLVINIILQCSSWINEHLCKTELHFYCFRLYGIFFTGSPLRCKTLKSAEVRKNDCQPRCAPVIIMHAAGVWQLAVKVNLQNVACRKPVSLRYSPVWSCSAACVVLIRVRCSVTCPRSPTDKWKNLLRLLLFVFMILWCTAFGIHFTRRAYVENKSGNVYIT